MQTLQRGQRMAGILYTVRQGGIRLRWFLFCWNMALISMPGPTVDRPHCIWQLQRKKMEKQFHCFYPTATLIRSWGTVWVKLLKTFVPEQVNIISFLMKEKNISRIIQVIWITRNIIQVVWMINPHHRNIKEMKEEMTVVQIPQRHLSMKIPMGKYWTCLTMLLRDLKI